MLLASSLLALLSGAPWLLGSIPDDPKEFAKRYAIGEATHIVVGGLDVWVEDGKTVELVREPIDKAMKHVAKWLGSNPLAGKKVRVIVLKKPDAFAAILRDLAEETRAAKLGNGPDEAFAAAAAQAGSCSWGSPALILVHTQALPKGKRDTRIVHDLGHLVAAALVGTHAVAPPALAEGMAGELVRVAVPKPDAVVCSESAAVKETTEGYGVFAAIGSVVNDLSNDPTTWPRLLGNVVKALKKSAAKNGVDPNAKLQVAAVLGRRGGEFQRGDYAFGWSVISFLLNDPARRARVLKELGDARAEYDAAPSADARIDHFRDHVMKAVGLDAAAIHAAWLDWAEKTYRGA